MLVTLILQEVMHQSTPPVPITPRALAFFNEIDKFPGVGKLHRKSSLSRTMTF